MSRRRTRLEKEGARPQVPDWVWGAGLGVIVLVFIGAFFLFSQLGGASNDPCGKALPALGQQTDVTAQAFADEDAALGHMIDFFNQGDVNAANTLFLGPVHNFTHNVDPPIRARNEGVARTLCRAVLTLENVLITPQTHATPEQLAADTVEVRSALRDGAEALGFPRPTG
jgi:hypothetical protein